MADGGKENLAFSVVVPVFRTGPAVLGELCDRIDRTLLPLSPHYEIILVDDSDRAEQWESLRVLARAHPHLRGLRLGRNYGQHNALLAGIRAARGAIVLTLDDDLQNPPEDIPALLAALDDPAVDVVYGLPPRRRHGPGRNAGAWLFKGILASALGGDLARMVSPFRAFRRDLRDGFAAYRGPDVMIDVLLGWTTSRFTAVAVGHDSRAEGRSGYSPRRLAGLALTMTVGLSTLPLRLSSLLGLAFAGIGAILLAYVLLNYLMSSRHVAGFTFLASLVIIFSGVQLLSLGLIGEYLSRLHFRTMGQPSYTVRDEIGPATGGQPHD